MPKLPKPSKIKELPDGTIEEKETPVETELVYGEPNITPALEIIPDESKQIEEVPEESKPIEQIPEESPMKTEMPSDYIEENCIMFNNEKRELKPTKLKYFRNKAASGYGIIKAVPLHELLTYGKGVFDETRDADQLLYDFLIAAFDDPIYVRDNYDDFDADMIERVVKIFGRINHIDEKQEAIERKNREAQAKR